MSEGTMQRRAQRDDQRDQPTKRAGGVNRVVAAAAALPLMLLVAGCSSDSGSDSGTATDAVGQDAGPGQSASAEPNVEPTVEAAAYGKLPEPCRALAKKTLGDLVPKAADKGKEGTSSDTGARASCSWSSLDNNGVKGSQFRWLNVSLVRFESDAASSGEQQAQEFYAKQVQDATAVNGAANPKSQPLAATGDQATSARYDLKKKEGAFKQQTVVSRVENVVVTVDYNGAGLAGEKTPGADGLVKSAEKAAKEVVAAVRSANGVAAGGGSSSPKPSATPSKGASSSAKPSASASESKAVSKVVSKTSSKPAPKTSSKAPAVRASAKR